MVARLALSSNNRNGQYVGTSLVTAPTPTSGSPTARYFNGAGDRVVGQRSSDLGPTFALLMTFWRADGTILPDDQVAARLFSQYCVGGTRVAVGINQDRLAVTYTTSAGQTFTVHTETPLMDSERHVLCLEVTSTEIILRLEGLEVLRVAATLRVPDTGFCNIGSDRARRFFKGTIDDLAIFQTAPGRFSNWTRYHAALVRKTNPRDYVPSIWGEGVHSTVITDNGFEARGTSASPLSQVRLADPFSTAPEVNPALAEFRFTGGSTAVRIGLVPSGFQLGDQTLGEGSSYAYTEDGRLINQGATEVSGIPTWTSADSMAFGYDAAASIISLWKNGVQIHSYPVPAGTWYLAVAQGDRQVRVNTGQRLWRSFPVGTTGIYSAAWSRLATEFHHMKVGEVAALLNDTDGIVRDANSGLSRGVYLAPIGDLAPSLTNDSLDTSRETGGGLRITSEAWTAPDFDFFFAIGFSPTAADLVGERVLLMSPWSEGDRVILSLVDGRLYAAVSYTNVGTSNVAVEVGKKYFIGITRGTTGKLMVWSSHGYLLQSDSPSPAIFRNDMWIGVDDTGNRRFEGLISHLVLASARPAAWKLDRLAKAALWDKPIVDGLEPSAATQRQAYEPSWRDVVANLGVASPNPDACYFGMLAAQPDELTLDYRFVARSDADPFEGDRISSFAPRALTTNGIYSNVHPAMVTLTSINDLDRVIVGTAAIINDEVMRVAMINLGTSTVTLDRGCADTIPADHPVGSTIWFQDGNLGSDLVPRLAGTSADGKVLTRTVLGELPEGSAETDTLPFTGRLARPYPPANLRINDMPEPNNLVGVMEVKWALRSAQAQGGGLVAWTEDSVVPVSGTTFVVRMFDATNDVLLVESPPLAYNVVAYDLAADFDGQVRVTVTSYLNGHACLQVPEASFGYVGNVTVLLTTEGGEPLTTEDDQAFLLEGDSTAPYASFSGHPAGSWRTLAEEEEEEEGANPMAVDGIIGVPISELPRNTEELDGDEIFPIVRAGENYFQTITDLLTYIQATLPPPADGKSAYQIWLDEGNVGTEAQFLDSLVGPRGLNSNQARRIHTSNSVSGTFICNWALYDEVRIRLVGDVTLVFQGAVDGQGCSVKISQDSAGGHDVTLPTNVRYNQFVGSGYTVSQAPNLVDRVAFIYDSSSSTYDFSALAPGFFTGP